METNTTHNTIDDVQNNKFVHLHLHTQYSLLDGAIRLDDLFKKLKEDGMTAVAQTDHGNMFGAIDFYLKAREHGIKPIIGCEVYYTGGSRFDRITVSRNQSVESGDEEEANHRIHHLVLLCKNLTGYKNLCKIVSTAYLEGFYYKPRIDFEILKDHCEGLIATSACLKGEVAYNFFIGEDKKAHEAITKLKSLFKDDFYLEIQENNLPEQDIANKKIVEYAHANNIPLVATNDCHYLNKEDAHAHEVLLCIQTGKNLADEKRMKLTSDAFYVKTTKEMRDAFHYAPEACDNTLKIAEMCNVELKWTDESGKQIYILPKFEIETNESEEDYLSRTAYEGLLERFNGPHFREIVKDSKWESETKQQYIDRLYLELKVINNMGFAGYFLIVADFIQWAKKENIPVGPGRGSGAGSLVAYSLKITNINPIPFNLLFERFMNPERISMPDFDVDFCQDRRQEVIEYVTKKYGEERVAQIVTFGTLKPKAVIKDVCRVFELPFNEANLITKLIPEDLKMTLDKALAEEPKLQELIDNDAKIKQIFNISRRLEGLFRHAGVHAAGVIITSGPVVDYSPLMRGKEGERVVQFDKNFAEKIGLVKFDFLGLKTLTVIKNAEKFIRRDFDKSFDIESINMNDAKIFEFISKGNTIGVFQLESSGMIDLCKRLMPSNLEDVTAINALYRPGPLESGMVDDFIEIKHKRKEMTFPYPVLEPVLKDTYGVIIYQEQVMNIARVIAGYTMGSADMLRSAMGKKKEKEMIRHREIFLKGAEKNGYDLAIAANLYDLMSNFAAYGFNKSHAVAYAVIAYQTAFLKCYYPAPFYAALLSTELDNKDKVTLYINDAKKFGVEVFAPDINESIWEFNVVGNNIRFGLGAVKNVGNGAVIDLMKEREKNGPFKSLIDFCERNTSKTINKRMLESLIKVGAFDNCLDSKSINRKTMLDHLELIIANGQRKQSELESGQFSLFAITDAAMGKTSTTPIDLGIKIESEFSKKEMLAHELELIGIYVSGHPLGEDSVLLQDLVSMPIRDVQEIVGENKREIILGGLITSKKQILTKKGDKMAFMTLEDLIGSIECVVFPRAYEEYFSLLENSSDEPLIIYGEVNLAENPRKILVSKILRLKDQKDERVKRAVVKIDLQSIDQRKVSLLKANLLNYRGSTPIDIFIVNNERAIKFELGEQFFVNPTPQFATKINNLFNKNCVKFITD